MLHKYEKKEMFNINCKIFNLPKKKHNMINGALICPEHQPGYCGDCLCRQGVRLGSRVRFHVTWREGGGEKEQRGKGV